MWGFAFVTCFTFLWAELFIWLFSFPNHLGGLCSCQLSKFYNISPQLNLYDWNFCILKILPDWKYQNTNTVVAGYSSVMSLNMLFSAVYMELELFPFLIDIQNLQFCVCFMWKGISWHLWASMVLEYSGVCPVLFKECWCQQSQISKS
jgi:hypothetical protein